MWRDRHFTLILILLLGVPLLAMALLPLADTTEPRYAEIARLMAYKGDWITPWFDQGVPFWGKPPLSFWAQAVAFVWLGVNDFAPRFPSWLVTIFTLWVLYQVAAVWFDRVVAQWTVLVYASCVLVFIMSGAVLTDPYLTLGTTLSMAGVVMAGRKSGVFWRYSFFLGLATGLLAKGPLALVLVGGALVPWFCFFPAARSAIKGLPWVKGLLLVLVLVLPWYIAAELKTPGFLDYFLVGEHVRRFLDPGWAGDLYGTAHRAAYGTIWFYWLQATFPWGAYAVVVLLLQLASGPKRRVLFQQLRDERIVYLLGWALCTPAFFTISGNVLWTYVLPAIPAFSMLVALSLARPGRSAARHPARFLALLAPLVALVLVFWMQFDPGRLKTEKWLVNYVQQQGEPGLPLYYLDDLPFSARFYSQETAQRITRDALPARLGSGGDFWLAVPKHYPPVPGVSDIAIKVFESRYFNLLRVTPVNRSPGTSQATLPNAQPGPIQ